MEGKTYQNQTWPLTGITPGVASVLSYQQCSWLASSPSSESKGAGREHGASLDRAQSPGTDSGGVITSFVLQSNTHYRLCQCVWHLWQRIPNKSAKETLTLQWKVPKPRQGAGMRWSFCNPNLYMILWQVLFCKHIQLFNLCGKLQNYNVLKLSVTFTSTF